MPAITAEPRWAKLSALAHAKTLLPTVDILGKEFGRLTVLGFCLRTRWACACACSAIVVVRQANLMNGSTKSCGCRKREVAADRLRTHGQSHTPTYNSWRAMLDRCYGNGHEAYGRYGGRGITVCPQWRHSFDTFLADMGERPPGLSLDRKDNDGNYEPANCRWATRTEQSRNRRPLKVGVTGPRSVFLTIDGRTLTLAGWSREAGVGESTIRRRLRCGWQARDAVYRPPAGKAWETRRATARAAEIANWMVFDPREVNA